MGLELSLEHAACRLLLPSLTPPPRSPRSYRTPPTRWGAAAATAAAAAAAAATATATATATAAPLHPHPFFPDQYRDGEGTMLPLWKFFHEKAKKKHVTSVT